VRNEPKTRRRTARRRAAAAGLAGVRDGWRSWGAKYDETEISSVFRELAAWLTGAARDAPPLRGGKQLGRKGENSGRTERPRGSRETGAAAGRRAVESGSMRMAKNRRAEGDRLPRFYHGAWAGKPADGANWLGFKDLVTIIPRYPKIAGRRRRWTVRNRVRDCSGRKPDARRSARVRGLRSLSPERPSPECLVILHLECKIARAPRGL